MDVEDRRHRRDEAHRRVIRQRRLVAGLVLLVPALVIAIVVLSTGGGSDSEERKKAAPKPPSLPDGTRAIFPGHRVVAFYGAPQNDELGELGIGTPAQAARRLRKVTTQYKRPGTPVLPAFELIATVAAAHPGDDGKYRYRQRKGVIRRYLAAARKAGAILLLDIQPGRADFVSEAKYFREFLEEPDVSLALDPEWRMGPAEVPGQVIGQVDVREVNRVSKWLSGIVRRKNLPQKLFVLHQFVDDMLPDKDKLEKRYGLATVLNVDGFGTPPQKLDKYREFTRPREFKHYGYKLFYREDTNLMKPSEVLRMRPRPKLVIYE